MHKFIKYFITIFGYLAVLYPLWVRFSVTQWSFDATLAATIFPFLGLLMASLLWLHSLAGVFEPWLRKYINFDRFVDITATIILVCLIAHPLLLLISMNFSLTDIYTVYGKDYIVLGITAWCLLILYDIGKFLKKRGSLVFSKNWKTILLISNIGFLLSFLHSLNLGSDLQADPLRFIWIFYGITATLAIAYTYGVKKFLK